jgi:hypothetical protein
MDFLYAGQQTTPEQNSETITGQDSQPRPHRIPEHCRTGIAPRLAQNSGTTADQSGTEEQNASGIKAVIATFRERGLWQASIQFIKFGLIGGSQHRDRLVYRQRLRLSPALGQASWQSNIEHHHDLYLLHAEQPVRFRPPRMRTGRPSRKP